MHLEKGNYKFYIGDFFEVAKKLPEQHFQLTFTSPPYNVGIEYDEHDDRMPHKEYLKFLTDAFYTALNLTREGGYVLFNIFDGLKYYNKVFEYYESYSGELNDLSEFVPPHHHLYNEMILAQTKNLGVFCIDMIWDQVREDTTAWGSFHSPSAVRSRTNHEFIFGFQKHGESQSKGISKDVTRREWMHLTRSVWSVPTIPDRSSHPASFPVELAERAIKLTTHKGDPILDPFAGLGTTLYAGWKLNRLATGIELSKKYVSAGRRKFNKMWNKTKRV